MNHITHATQLPGTGSSGAAMNDSSSPEVGAFTVLKACTNSGPDQESTLMDHRPLPRSRRRRTSPEDQAVLESEFLRNPKPDRAKRTEIVSRVTLGEKEVQIWFQNRRQIARRKSGTSANSTSPTIFRNVSTAPSGLTEQNTPNQASQIAGKIQSKDFTSTTASAIHAGGRGEESSNTIENGSTRNDVPTPDTEVVSGSVIDTSDACTDGSNMQDDNIASSDLTQNPSSSSKETTATQELSIACIGESSSSMKTQASANLPPLLIKRKSSSLRLSTSADGKAQIVVDNGSSPPRPPSTVMQKLARPQHPLRRSLSEVSSQFPSNLTFADSMPAPRRLAPSRSRDARSWEFCCDSDARNALTIQAENEQKGKAEATIGLIRSSSASKKTIPPALSAVGSTKRKGTSRKSQSRPKLARTESSVARLQSMSSNKYLILKSETLAKKGSSQSMLAVDLSGDLSDKENWLPGTRRRHIRSPRPESEMRNRSTLTENSEIPSHSNSLEGHLERDIGRRRRQSGTPTDKENEEPQDPEVAAFMGESTGPRVAEDLDCVQQLLSLSQGAWS